VTTHDEGVLDTSIIAALKLYDPAELPDTIYLTAITLGELSYGPHATDDAAKRAARVAVLQHVEATFDPLPYDQDAARFYGQICAAVRAADRAPRKRAADLMIAAIAANYDLPLYTANPADFKGSEGFVEIVAINPHPNTLLPSPSWARHAQPSCGAQCATDLPCRARMRNRPALPGPDAQPTHVRCPPAARTASPLPSPPRTAA
jgi:predicted nucleic acid-binding protein